MTPLPFPLKHAPKGVQLLSQFSSLSLYVSLVSSLLSLYVTKGFTSPHYTHTYIYTHNTYTHTHTLIPLESDCVLTPFRAGSAESLQLALPCVLLDFAALQELLSGLEFHPPVCLGEMQMSQQGEF